MIYSISSIIGEIVCGIAGIYYKKSIDLEQKNRFRELVLSYQHSRGPDAFNELKIQENLFFFHNRLSIIDVKHAAQPMEDEDGILTFNGEIYNYESLRERDIPYQYKSDTEVLLKGFSKHGRAFLHQTNFMFGFAYYDKQTESISLYRDRIGIKQLYYIDNDEVFAFASTLKPLVLFSQKNLNTKALWGYYLNRAFKAPHTIFDDIKELEAGRCLMFSTKKNKVIKVEPWWTREHATETMTDENEVLERLDYLLHQSIKDRLVADVSVGAFLSGGVDSSLITAIASQYHPDIEVFTVAMGDQRYDESAYAKGIAQQYGLRYHETKLSGKEFLNDIQRWISMQDDIVADPSSLMLNTIASLAQKHGYKVMLAGEGADELFAGYGTHKRFLLSKQAYRYLKVFKPLSSSIANLFKGDSRKKFFIQNLLSDPAFYGAANIFEPYLIEEMLGQHVEKVATPNIKYALERDIKDRIPNDLMTSNDRATMGASIETRVPLLAHQLVNFTASIDHRLFTKNATMKYLLKKLAENYIPHKNIYRKKVGFEMPLSDWIKVEFKEMLQELIENSIQREILDINVIKILFHYHINGKINATAKLFAFMALELSYKHLKEIH